MRNNGAKYIVVVALLISVVALSLGFAAFTSTLTISSEATVTGNSNAFNIQLSKANNAFTSGSVTPQATGTGTSGQNATINSAGTTISGLKATLGAKGSSVKYTLYAYNSGSLLGYLNSVSFGSKTCTAKTGTTQSYVNAACDKVTLSVKIGSQTYTASNTNISSHTLPATSGSNYETVEVTIALDSNAPDVDGDFDVSFGDVTIIYGSAD